MFQLYGLPAKDYAAAQDKEPSLPLSDCAFHKAGVKLLYIGGIYNLLGNTRIKLTPIAQKLQTSGCPVPSYFALDYSSCDEDAFSKKVQEHYEARKADGVLHPTPYAEALVDRLFLPPPLVEQWKQLADPTDCMKDHFSTINIVAYSFGSHLLQQADVCLQDRLACHGLPTDPINSMKAISIGGTCEPVENGKICQLVLVNEVDERLPDSILKKLFANKRSVFPHLKMGSATIIGEKFLQHIPSYMTLDARTEKVACGDCNIGPHHFYQYTMPPISTNTGNPVYFRRSATGTIFQEACTEMIAASGHPFAFQGVGVVHGICDRAAYPLYHRDLAEWMTACHAECSRIYDLSQSAPSGRGYAVARKELAKAVALAGQVPEPTPCG